LHLHSVLLRRGNESVDQLRAGRIRILQREDELEDDVLDGRLTFHLLLSDVRVGDVIEYSYTIERRDPEWQNHFFGRYHMQWDDPVTLARLRVMTPVGKPLNVRSFPEQAPTSSSAAGWRVLEWSKSNSPAFQYEKQAPSWFVQHALIEISQFNDWAEIVNAALILYKVTSPPSPELIALIERLKSTSRSNEDRAVEAMRFVQDEVRYTGIEEGEGAYRPRPPNEVLKRRYGDCKDKTLLAVTLLKALGFEAAPAIVSTRWRQEANNHLPSPGLMNHVVVRAQISGQTYWFDATTTNQGGGLANFSQAQFGQALVIAPGVAALENMSESRSSYAAIRSQLRFDFSAGLNSDTTLNITTTYLDHEADVMRRTLRSKSAAEFGKEYLRYYKGRYPGATSIAALEIKDDRERNVVVVVEAYKIDKAFEHKNGKLRFYVHPEIVTDELKAPEMPERSTPLALEYPDHVASQIVLRLPKKWNVTRDAVNIETRFFRYDSKLKYSDDEITLDYDFRTLTDHVPVAELPGYIKQLDRAENDTYYSLYTDEDAPLPQNEGDSLWMPRLLALLAGAFLAFRLLRVSIPIQALLATSLRRSTPSSRQDEQVPEAERRLLKSCDEEFQNLEFIAAGFMGWEPMDTRHEGLEHVRLFINPDRTIRACVARRMMPEYGAYTHFWLESDLADGKTVHTTQRPEAHSIDDPQLVTEVLLNATPAELLGRHKLRLEQINAVPVTQPADALTHYAAEFSKSMESLRARWRAKGWTHASEESEFERFSLKGAIYLAMASVRWGKRTARGASRKQWTALDRQLRVDADLLAVSRLSKAPQSATGANRSLLVFSALWLCGLFAIAVAGFNFRVSLLIFAALVVHELGHLLAIKLVGRRSSMLFFLPFIGLSKNQDNSAVSHSDQIVIVLAGPLTGLISALLLLTANSFWPNRFLVLAVWASALLNGLLLVPIPTFDGARVLDAITRTGTVSRLVAQLFAIVVVCILAFWLHSDVLGSAGIAFGLWGFLLIAGFRAVRVLVAHIPRDASWADAARASLEAMTQDQFRRWRAATRQLQASFIAKQMSAPKPVGAERWQPWVAYALCAVLAICVALCVRG
jgi:Zn-dependent protease